MFWGVIFAFEISKVGIENDFIVKTAFYLLLMQIGYICRKNSKFCNMGKVISAVGVLVGLIGTYGWKILERKSSFFYNFQLVSMCFWGALFVVYMLYVRTMRIISNLLPRIRGGYKMDCRKIMGDLLGASSLIA